MELAGLREDPFTISPPTDPERVIWAGMDVIKDEFDSVFREAKVSAPTQVVLCRGPIGGGKTHASLFFSSDKNIPKTSPSVQNIEVLRVQTPTETGNPARDFYQDVMEQIRLDRIGEAIKKNVESVGRDVVERNLRQTMVSGDFVNALLKLFLDLSNFSGGWFATKCHTSLANARLLNCENLA